MSRVKRHWLTIAFILGFLVDNITLNRVDQVFDNLVLFTYVILAMVSLLLMYASVAGKLVGDVGRFANRYAPLLVQFSFGGLLSGMLIFYGRSGDWSASWPFMVVILLAIYFNETISDRAQRMVYNLVILFIGLFSYVVLVVPVLTGLMGAGVFVLCGLFALFMMYWFVQLLYRIVPNYLELQMRTIVFLLGSVFAAFNFLYFTNIIPPIPLSLKEVGIFHNVVRLDDGGYQLTHVDGAWWQFFKNSDKTYYPSVSHGVFCFAKVFAPTKLETEIFHRWEKYNDETGRWEDRSRLSYSISGGRDGGYRGYTLIRNYEDGRWRCTVETKRGQVLGREEFTIDSTGDPRELVTRFE